MIRKDVESTESLRPDLVSFPRARLKVVSGPSMGSEVLLEGQTVVVGSDESCQLVLQDASVSRQHFEVSGGPKGFRLRDLQSTNGIHVAGLQVSEARLIHAVRIQVGRSELRFEPEKEEVKWPLSTSEHFGSTYGTSAVMRRLFALLEKAVNSPASVVFEGEAGTGKKLLARSLHEQSPSGQAPFVVLDVPAHDDAQVSAALDHAAKEAEGGTLLLADVEALPLALQAQWARRLEQKALPLRVVATSRKNLENEVKHGRFREDLFFRLAVFRFKVPPLRERMEDLPGLSAQWAAQPETLWNTWKDMLLHHPWKGNVRELRFVVERLSAAPDLGIAVLDGLLNASASSEEVTAASEPSLQSSLKSNVMLPLLKLPYHEAKERVLEAFDRSFLSEHLRNAKGVITHAAQNSGIPRQSLHRMLKRLGMSEQDDDAQA